MTKPLHEELSWRRHTINCTAAVATKFIYGRWFGAGYDIIPKIDSTPNSLYSMYRLLVTDRLIARQVERSILTPVFSAARRTR